MSDIKHHIVPDWMRRVLAGGDDIKLRAPEWLDHWGSMVVDGVNYLVSEPYGISEEMFADIAAFANSTGCTVKITAPGSWSAATVRITIGPPKHEDDSRYINQPYDHEEAVGNWVVVYGLADPRDGKYRYVGQTIDLDRRTAQHLAGDRNWEKTRWIRELQAANCEPAVSVLEKCTILDCRERERDWIVKLRQEGHPLLTKEYGRSVNAATEDWQRLGAILKRVRSLLFLAQDEAQRLVSCTHAAINQLRTATKHLDQSRCRLDSTLYKLTKVDCHNVFYGDE